MITGPIRGQKKPAPDGAHTQTDIRTWRHYDQLGPRGAELVKIREKLFLSRRFYILYEQEFLNLRPLLSITFPQGFKKFKKFGHWTSGSGDKKTVKRSEKVWQTNRQTDTHTDISTFIKNRPRGPILWKCDSNYIKKSYLRETLNQSIVCG